MGNLTNIFFNISELLYKSVAPIGEIREWSGKKYKKVAQGKWVPFNEKYSKKDIVRSERDLFGPIFKQFKNKPSEAVRFLSEKKTGHAKAVWNKEGIGEIDIIYGSNNKGLKHIIGKHSVFMDDFKDINDLSDKIEDILKEGEITHKNDNRAYIEKDGFRAVVKKSVIIDKEDNFKDKFWILTSYDKSRTEKEKTILKSTYPHYGNLTNTSLQDLGGIVPSIDSNIVYECKYSNYISTLQQKIEKSIAQIGEIRNWGGKTYKKIAQGKWVLVSNKEKEVASSSMLKTAKKELDEKQSEIDKIKKEFEEKLENKFDKGTVQYRVVLGIAWENELRTNEFIKKIREEQKDLRLEIEEIKKFS